jgi:Rod binding domain-containing protein
MADQPISGIGATGAGAALATGGAASLAAIPPEPKPRNAGEAAKQFEAVLIAQMMRSAHDSGEGGMGSDPDSTSETMWDVAAQQFAKVLANNGGVGLAKLVEKGIQPPAPKTSGLTSAIRGSEK